VAGVAQELDRDDLDRVGHLGDERVAAEHQDRADLADVDGLTAKGRRSVASAGDRAH